MLTSTNIVDKVVEILKKYPLCDRCLGRLFGYLGKGMSNLERGKALKTVTILEVHRKLQENEIDLDTAKAIVLNAQRADVLKFFDVDASNNTKPCYICRNMIDKWIDEFSHRIASILFELKVSSFIIGVRSADEYMLREETLVKEFGLAYRETIKRELKREVGKKVSLLANIKPVFENPEVVMIINLTKNDIEIDYPSLIFYGYYWKLGRMISQNVWIGKNGARRYALAVEDAIKHVSTILNANGYKLHIAGREDVDVRVLGNGRPLAIEFKALGKGVNMELLENMLNSYTPWLKFKIMMRVGRGFISRLKGGAKLSKKVYRAIVYTSIPINHEAISTLELVFKDRIIEQRTPTRILRRKKDRLRRRKVYKIKVIPIAPQLLEVLIECDGGLYVKELISGDNGRTKPSFSDVLGCSVDCLMLDVIYVHEYI